MQEHPSEAEVPTGFEQNHYTVHGAQSEQLDGDLERVDDDGYPLVDENGSTLVLVPRDKPLFGRMKESGDVLEIEDDRGKIHTERWLDFANRLTCSAQIESSTNDA